MPPQFRFGDIESICKRLGMSKKKGQMLWKGIGLDKVYRQTTIHSHGDGGTVSNITAKEMAKQLRFKDIDDMYDFLTDKNRKS